MITKQYNCEFLSDIVLNSSSNTQGNIVVSDFIAGSNFLGMVAKSYNDFGTESFEVFHSGDVRFGDAHLVIDNKMSFKTPLSFHRLKVGAEVFNRLHLSKDEEKNLRKEQKQLKQVRDGFVNSEFKILKPTYNYSQKSKYSAEKRRSEDSGMFGYSALKKGTNWAFKVQYKNEQHIQKVEENLLGKQKLGKSKSSQYGLVNITESSLENESEIFTPNDDLTYLYLNSRVVLIDNDGNFTAIPSIENLGLDSGEIDWERTYIKSSIYTPYNYKRQTKEYTRVCLNKGSVITIKNLQGDVENGIGAFLSEGFGDVLVNPKFLDEKKPFLREADEGVLEDVSKDFDKNLISYLQNKENIQELKFKVSSHVKEVYEKFVGPSKSQWGEIRIIASKSQSKDELIQKINKYILGGVAKKQWESIKDKFIAEINKSDESLEFTKLLAMTVSKNTKGAKDAK